MESASKPFHLFYKPIGWRLEKEEKMKTKTKIRLGHSLVWCLKWLIVVNEHKQSASFLAWTKWKLVLREGTSEIGHMTLVHLIQLICKTPYGITIYNRLIIQQNMKYEICLIYLSQYSCALDQLFSVMLNCWGPYYIGL